MIQDVVSGGMNLFLGSLITVILVVKTINLKSLKIKKIIFLLLFYFIFSFPCFLLFVSAYPQLFLWLCAWNDPEMI